MEQNKYIPGDLICIIEKGFEPILSTVMDVNDGTPLFCDGYGDVYWFTKFSPIPLTAEILDKNGWEHKDDVYFKEYPKRKLVVMGGEASIINESCSLFLCKVEFVHQLQHLLLGLGLDSNLKI